MSIGAMLGDKLQRFGESVFTKLLGRGDYQMSDQTGSIKKNSMMKASDARPIKFDANKSSYVFEHSEYIRDITSSSTIGAFNLDSFTVNPAIITTFPWLAQMAQYFEYYEVEGLLFRFQSLSADSVGTTNTAIGSIMSAFLYDTLDTPITSKQQLLQYDGSCDAKISESMIVGVECDPKERASSKLYIAPTVPSNADAKTYNLGNLVIATQGLQAASQTVGELWVHYRIKFHMAKQINFVPYSAHAYGPFVAIATPYTAITLKTSGNGNISVNTSSSLTLTNLNVGQIYKVTQIYSGTSGAIVAGTASFTGGTTVNLYNNDQNFAVAPSGITNSTAVCDFTFVATKTSGNLPVVFTTGPSNGYYDVYVTALDSTLTN